MHSSPIALPLAGRDQHSVRRQPGVWQLYIESAASGRSGEDCIKCQMKFHRSHCTIPPDTGGVGGSHGAGTISHLIFPRVPLAKQVFLGTCKALWEAEGVG